MKNISWEIIVAGLLFAIVGIVLLNKSDNNDSVEREKSQITTTTVVKSTVQRPGVTVLNIETLNPANLQAISELIADSQYTDALRSLTSSLQQLPDSSVTSVNAKLDTIDSILNNISAVKKLSLDNRNNLIINRGSSNNSSGWTEVGAGIYERSYTLDAENMVESSINLSVGNIIFESAEQETATLTVRASGSISDANFLAERFTSDLSMVNGSMRFDMQSTTEDRSDIQIEARLFIPSDIPISAYTGGGHINITDIASDHTLETAGGHIRLTKVKGDIVAITKGGHISVDDASGVLTLKTSGGHLQVTGFNGNINGSSSGGNISLQNVNGDIVTSTKGGNITIQLENLAGDINAEADAGNISIELTPGSRFNTELKASNSIDIQDFEFDEISRMSSTRIATMDGASNMIRAFTRFGSISLQSNE